MEIQTASADLRICNVDGEDIIITQKDRFCNTMIVGPTGAGKTHSLKRMVHQDIEFIANGGQAAVIVVEPSEEVTSDVAKQCDQLGVPYIQIDLQNPQSLKWNPLDGDPIQVAEIVAEALGSHKMPFFQEINTTNARIVTLVLKYALGDKANLQHLADALGDTKIIRKYVNDLKAIFSNSEENEAIDDAIRLIESEMKDHRFEVNCTYLSDQLNRMLMHGRLRNFVSGESTFDLEQFLEKPGVLLIKSGIETDGDLLVKFILGSLRDAVVNLHEKSTMPVFTYIEEFGRYATERYMNSFILGYRFRWANIVTVQSFAQLTSIPDCQNRIFVPGMAVSDAVIASKLLEHEISADHLMYMHKDHVAFRVRSNGNKIIGEGVV